MLANGFARSARGLRYLLRRGERLLVLSTSSQALARSPSGINNIAFKWTTPLGETVFIRGVSALAVLTKV